MSGASQTPTACELVDDIPRDTLRYTPLFCEENIWWLARTLVDRGVDPGTLQVWFLTNHARSIVLLEQRAGKGRALAWDYHVVLQASAGDGQWIFDFDSRLGFPVPIAEYLRRGFPRQAALPMRFRTWVRRVPAADYLVHPARSRCSHSTCPARASSPFRPVTTGPRTVRPRRPSPPSR